MSNFQVNFKANAARPVPGNDVTEAPDFDPLWRDVALFVSDYDFIRCCDVQRKFQLGYKRANCILTQLCEMGLIGDLVNDVGRRVFCSKEEAEAFTRLRT